MFPGQDGDGCALDFDGGFFGLLMASLRLLA
jgi:hypothetical protein